MLNGSEILIKAIKDCGTDTIFGYPGGSIIKTYDELYKQKDIKHILSRHEQGAVHMAQAYSRTTDKVGVVLVTSGPGSTNTVTGINDAFIDSTPLVVISGQVRSNLIGTDAFQEANICGITSSITKHNYLIKDVADLEKIVKEAFHLATTGRPGPVLIDLPFDVQAQEYEYKDIAYQPRKSYTNYAKLNEKEKSKIDEVVKLLQTSQRPLLIGGGGIISSGDKACKAFMELSNRLNIPTTLTVMGLGAYSAYDKNYIGRLGMHGPYEANMATHAADLIITVGARFSDRITGNVSLFAPDAKIVHMDIDPVSINRIIAAHIGIVGDVYESMSQVLEKIDISKIDIENSAWWDKINKWKKTDSLYYDTSGDLIRPEYVIESLSDKVHNEEIDFILSTDVGQHQMWTSQHFKIPKPKSWVTSGGFGTMGFGVPACIGGAIANPDKTSICITSEGSIMMNIQEIATAVYYDIPIKIVLLNNARLGMVKQWQEILFEKRYSQTIFEKLPDFPALAKAMGADGLKIEKQEDLDKGFNTMLKSDKPFILEVLVDPKANVLPMIPPGQAHNQMILPKKGK